MFGFISSIFSYFFPTNNDNENDKEQELFLADQLLELEILRDQNEVIETPNTLPEIPRNTVCFQRSGLVTYMQDNYIFIDGMLYFDTSTCSLHFNTNDRILYLGYKDANDSVVVVRVLENYGLYWGDGEEDVIENNFKIIEHIIIGEVDYREERFVFIKQSDLKFSLDDVEGTFVPVKGDWLELKCSVQWDEEKPSAISTEQVLQVISFKPVRSKVKKVQITDWNGDHGMCDRQLYFDRQSLQNDTEFQVGSKVMVEAIESNQGTCTWRVIKMLLVDNAPIEKLSDIPNEEDNSLKLEKEKNVTMTYPIKFENVDFQKTARINIHITNNSNDVHIINKWIMLSKKRDSQVDIKPFLSRPTQLLPKQTFTFTVTCYPKFLGNSRECLIVMLKGFQIKRFIEINVVDGSTTNKNGYNKINMKNQNEKVDDMKRVRKNNGSFVPGVRPVKPPAFIPVKLGAFPIPEKIWSAVLGDSEQTIHSSEFSMILDRIESYLPTLIQELNINNYIDRWHTLLYMEEIQANISMRAHDNPKTFLIRCQDYLGIEINGLSEKRPSIIKGDRVLVKETWSTSAQQYEGYVHAVKGDMVLIKFNQQFHETYSGTDVSVQFHFSRGTYRRSHQAINLALSNLGPDILFPSRVSYRPAQVTTERLKDIKWFNENLNDGQKTAVTTILAGEGRPLPYCIYGPPGTGKTITVIETILQILTQLPESRILVATPSNSAANLITERLIQYRNVFSDSFIRLIANYLLDSENIPDIIKPFCATLDIARELTSKSKHRVNDDGINLDCQTSFVGRHRVTIGTCYCIGTLAMMGLPRSHFTHVIIDEAGQATEPEIMIPLTFTDKETGQIILAGDPMQLGPVIMSKYCNEYNMGESYLSRILETFPYQKDFHAFENGFNTKLVTKLNDNYRSLKEVLTLPSEMFYDGSLVPKMDRNSLWVKDILTTISGLFDLPDKDTGGIFVYGIRGSNMRAEDSPSWFNPHEASMVALTTCKLFKKNISIDDIGIITPYIAQIKYLRVVFDAMGLPQPKIGTVEEFQGQERPIILISTVRSTESLVQEDVKHALGFVKNPKRLNVALTRAQVAVLLFCNPHLLCTDVLWKKVISQAVMEDKYMGCDLPPAFKCSDVNVQE